MTLPRQRGLTEQAANTAIDTACRLLRLPSIRNEGEFQGSSQHRRELIKPRAV